jgi:hypothetical protein
MKKAGFRGLQKKTGGFGRSWTRWREEWRE